MRLSFLKADSETTMTKASENVFHVSEPLGTQTIWIVHYLIHFFSQNSLKNSLLFKNNGNKRSNVRQWEQNT